jgi:hypothetical protein
LGRSPTITPSAISMMRSVQLATCMSCVTMITVWPCACSSRRMPITSCPLFLSSAPVGSSARITSPPFMSARAMLTRCCCPPDSWLGRCSVRSPSPSRASSWRARVSRASPSVPAYTAGTSTLPAAVRCCMRW